jgi:hypothetical protein
MRQVKNVSSASIAIVGAVIATSVVTATSARAQTAAPPPPPAVQQPAATGEAAKAPPADSEEHERSAKNAVYAEGLGPGLFYSINYDRAFSDFALRVGVGYVSLSAVGTNGESASATFLSVPITVSYLGIGSLKHMLELGAGGSLLYFGGSVNTLGNSTSGSAVAGLGTLIVGYRFQPPDGGFLLRAGLSPLISSTGGFLPWPYLALGGTF